MREILILAGEASGDLHGAILAERLKARRPDLHLAGTGGSRMREAGVEMIEEHEGVVGFVEVLRHIPSHLRLLRTLKDRLASGRVGLVICIDYPGFNMRVAATAEAAGVPVLYYITPQVWAWRAGRMRTMARIITKAAVILPFEEQMLRGAGVDATFVGHPLLDRAQAMPDKAEARRRIGLPEQGELLALFPGSRAQEIRRHLSDFVAVARELEQRRPGLRVVLSVAPTIEFRADEVPFPMVRSASFDVLRAADVALCKSGTTTLEAAVAGCPCAIVYRTSAISYAIARRLVRIPHIGLLNIVAGREVAPEFVQDAFRPAPVADALSPLFDTRSPERERMEAGLAEVRAKLGTPGATERVAEMALGMLR
ncbi:MAG TPA: lipid-A-disaccharide synthase [Gemmatimonadaceae bacterium]|nr:lipid-A-disaccharide synthase [Gemmatimonadaceae bacterium]